MSFLKRKSVIITIIALLSVIGFSVVSLLVYDNVNKKENTSNQLQVNAYTFNTEFNTAYNEAVRTNWSNANNNAGFIVDSAEAFEFVVAATQYKWTKTFFGTVNNITIYDTETYYPYRFQHEVGGYVTLTDPSSGEVIKNWVERTVKVPIFLTKDITVTLTDEQDEHLRDFGGIFDGMGHTITFQYSDTYDECSPWEDEWNGGYSPFCDKLSTGGEIKNLKIKNVKVNVGSAFLNSSPIYVGGIVGENLGTVKNCIVENIKCRSDRYNEFCHVAGIAGISASTAIIQDCLVTGAFEVGVQDDSWNLAGDPDGINAYYFVAASAKDNEKGSSGVATSCFKATFSEFGDWESRGYKEDSNSGTYYKDRDFVKTPGDSSGYTDSVSNSSYTSKSSASALGSSIGGTQEDTNQAWYYGGEEYRDGWPMLRVFLDWQSIYFKSNNESIGTVSPGEILVPNDAYTDLLENHTGVEKIIVYKRTITASVNDNAYGIQKWQWDYSNSTYTVYFSQSTTQIKFLLDDNIQQLNHSSDDNEYTVLEGSEIEVTVTYCYKSSQKVTYNDFVNDAVTTTNVKCISSIEYRFVEVSTHEDYAGVEWIEMNSVSIIFTLSGRHSTGTPDRFIFNPNSSQLENFTAEKGHYSNNYVVPVCLYTALKEFNITFA